MNNAMTLEQRTYPQSEVKGLTVSAEFRVISAASNGAIRLSHMITDRQNSVHFEQSVEISFQMREWVHVTKLLQFDDNAAQPWSCVQWLTLQIYRERGAEWGKRQNFFFLEGSHKLWDAHIKHGCATRLREAVVHVECSLESRPTTNSRAVTT